MLLKTNGLQAIPICSNLTNEIRAKNSEYLDLFEHALITNGLKDSTIKKHLSNIDLYINNFLLYEEPLTMDYGMGRSDSFLGDFFIRKCVWSTPGSIKSTTSFYMQNLFS